jgi:hypothetical protein
LQLPPCFSTPAPPHVCIWALGFGTYNKLSKFSIIVKLFQYWM